MLKHAGRLQGHSQNDVSLCFQDGIGRPAPAHDTLGVGKIVARRPGAGRVGGKAVIEPSLDKAPFEFGARNVEIDRVVEQIGQPVPRTFIHQEVVALDKDEADIACDDRRAGAFELAGRTDVPVSVVISEYVEVARLFLDGDEPKFVNAVLDRLAPQLRDGVEAAG